MTKVWSLTEAVQQLGDETKAIPVEFQQLVDEMRGSRKSAVIFILKYCMTDESGNLLEYNKEQVWKRIVKNTPNLSDDEKTQLFEALVNNSFVPGGRIISAMGSTQRVSPYNCYVIPAPYDTIDGIFNSLRDMAKTMSHGGGVGLDLSNLRPSGAGVSNSAKTSTGPVSFMNLFSEVTKTIGQNNRRGALMLTMRVDHPDVLDFINSKYYDEQDIDTSIVNYVRGDISLSTLKQSIEGLYKINHANISVKLTDAFMKAVEKDEMFELWWEGDIKGEIKKITKSIKARQIWEAIISRAWATAEPGVLFWDRIVEEHNGEYFAKLSSTNPCAEEPLPGYSCCCLSHVNLSTFVDYPFTYKATFNLDKFEQAVEIGVKFLNSVIDFEGSQALKEFKEHIPKERRIGLGITGLADMFIKLGLIYGDKKSKNLLNEIMSMFSHKAYRTSIMLAKRDGAFEHFDFEKFTQSAFMKRVIKEWEEKDPTFESDLKAYGIRNVTILSIAPVGTGSEITNGGISSGIEPVFAKEFTRRVKIKNEDKMFTDYPAIVREYRDTTGASDFPKAMITSHEITPDTRIAIQSIIQKYVDAAISSTINLDNNVSTSEIDKIYMNAWKSGCFLKGNDVYTKAGIKDISEIKQGDFVLSHDGQYHKVTEVFDLPEEDRHFVSIDIQGMENLITTIDHPVLVLRPTAKNWNKKAWEQQDPEMLWLPAGEIEKGDHVVLPVFNLQGEEIHELDVPKMVSCIERNGLVYPERNLPWKSDKAVIAANSYGIPSKIKIDEDFVWFLGWFIAEGHFQQKYYVRMTLNTTETNIADRIEKIIYEKFKLKARRYLIHSKGTSLRLEWGNKIFSQILEQLVGRGSYSKHLPSWFTGLSPKLLNIMLKAWWEGDKGSTSSRQLSREVFMAQHFLGETVQYNGGNKRQTIYKILPMSKRSGAKTWKNYKAFLVKGKSDFYNSSKVYNFAVEDTNSYVVNGVTVHNCKGITVYREGSREGILLTNKLKNKNLITKLFKNNRELVTPIPTEISSKTFSVKYKLGYKARITITHTDDYAPLQILVSTKAPEDEASAKQLGMLLTALFRKDNAVGLSSEWILNELREIKDTTAIMHKDDDSIYPVQISGLSQAVAHALSKFYKKYNKNTINGEGDVKEEIRDEMDLLEICPSCNAKAVKKDQCAVCLNCGWTKCM